jgi:hypothetical protein
MKECIREHEIVEAVVSGRWPGACDAELRSHAMDCAVCKDIISVAVALHDERDFALMNARVPSAGLVWWKAELRARREAARTAERPMKVACSLAAASVAGVGVALIAALSSYLRELLTAFIGLPEFGLLIGALATLLVIAPLALYFVFSDK